MSDQSGRIVCDVCGKTYPWRAEYAGRTVKCTCGQQMKAPSEPPSAAEPDLYDLADEPAPPKAKRAPVAAAGPLPPVASAAVPPPVKRSPQSAMAAYAQTAKKPPETVDRENAIGGQPLREIYIPIVLVLLGLAANVLLHMRGDGEEGWRPFTSVLPAIGLSLLFNLVLSFAGIMVVARWFEISFGHPVTAILKMSACILLPTAIANYLGSVVGSDSGFVEMMFSAMLMFPLTFAAVWYFFQLAADEAFWCVAVIYIMTDWATKFLLIMILSTGSTDALSFVFPGAEDQTVAVDADAKEHFEAGDMVDATEFLAGGPRGLGQFSREQSKQFLASIKDTGAPSVHISLPGDYRGFDLYIKLPDGKSAKRKCFKALEELLESHKVSLDGQSASQTYVVVELPGELEAPDEPVK